MKHNIGHIKSQETACQLKESCYGGYYGKKQECYGRNAEKREDKHSADSRQAIKGNDGVEVSPRPVRNVTIEYGRMQPVIDKLQVGC